MDRRQPEVKLNLMNLFEQNLAGDGEKVKNPKQPAFYPSDIKFHSALGSRLNRPAVNIKPKRINFDDISIGRASNPGMDQENIHEILVKPPQLGFTNLSKTSSIFDEVPHESPPVFLTAKKAKQSRIDLANLEKTKPIKKAPRPISFYIDKITMEAQNEPKLFSTGSNYSSGQIPTPPLNGRKDLVLHHWMKSDDFKGKFGQQTPLLSPVLTPSLYPRPLLERRDSKGSGKEEEISAPLFLKKQKVSSDLHFKKPEVKPFRPDLETIKRKTTFEEAMLEEDSIEGGELLLSNKKKTIDLLELSDKKQPVVSQFNFNALTEDVPAEDAVTPKNHSSSFRSRPISNSDMRLNRMDYEESSYSKYDSNSFKEEEGQVSRFENDFETIETLGAGNFGKVYKCKNKLDHSLYAVKITSKSLKSSI